MQGYDTTPAKVPALTRTWEVHVVYRECGVVTGSRTYTVKLDKTSGELQAIIDGELSTVERAVNILASAETKPFLLSETLPTPPSMARAVGVSA